MKKLTFIAIFLALSISFAVSQSARADFLTVATTATQQSEPSDPADVTSMFSFDSQSASDAADVYGFCTESPQQGNWERDPRKLETTPEFNDISPSVTPVSMTNSALPTSSHDKGHRGGKKGGGDTDTDTDTSTIVDEENITPEPTTMLVLGLGLAGLLPLSYRARRRI